MKTEKKQLTEKLKKIRAIFMDVDGVLTDGSAIFINGTTPKVWNVRDRLAIKAMKGLLGDDLAVIWITGRPCTELKDRASELGVDRTYSNISNKYQIMEAELSVRGLSFEEALYIGDDLIDLRCMEASGVSCAPKDAAAEVLAVADYISDKPGGKGAVRDILELFLKAIDRWDDLVEKFRGVGGSN
ncbi:MAG: HAD hydrolase family protein [Elusimicrobia bacterium]|nr:HAD hydrolase family protein [Elusimicrobiota bacterium]